MATATTEGDVEDVVPTTELYLNHRQPPIHIRLREVINFLADEDHTRFLGFEPRLQEIVSYLEWVSNQELYDEELSLLEKAKCMVKVQQEWIKRDTESEPINFNFNQTLPFSTRLQAHAKRWRCYQYSTEPVIEFERPDHPPFTLVRNQGTQPFIRALQTELLDSSSEFGTGNSLVQTEIKSYLDTEKQLYLVKHLDNPDKSPIQRAAKRGIQRKTIEMALNLLADNQEQYHDNDRLRALKIEQPEPLVIPEVRLCMEANYSQRPQGIEFAFTMKLLFRQKVEGDRAEKFRQDEIERFQRDPSYLPAPVNYRGPRIPVTKKKANLIHRQKIKDYLDVLDALERTAEIAPRPLIRQVILQIYHGMAGEYLNQSPELKALIQADQSDDKDQASKEGILDEEVSILLLLTEPSKNTLRGTPWNTGFIESIRGGVAEVDREKLIDHKLKTFAEYLEIILSPDNRPRNTLISVKEVIQAVNLMHTDRRPSELSYAPDDIEGMLEKLHAADIIFYLPEAFDGFGGIRRPWPNHHPEYDMTWYNESASKNRYAGMIETIQPAIDMSRIPRNLFLTYLAFKLGKSFKLLLDACDNVPLYIHDHTSNGHEVSVGEDWNAIVQQDKLMRDSIDLDEKDQQAIRIPKLRTIKRIAAGPPKLSMTLNQPVNLQDERDVRHHLLMMVIEENVWHVESFFPHYSNLWDFAALRIVIERKLRIYFSVNRWPLVMQTPERQMAIKKWAPIEEPAPVLRKKRKRIDPENDEEWWRAQGVEFFKGPPRERYINGPAYFPFGETPFQQEILSRKLAYDLKDVPGFADRPSASSRWGRWVEGVKSLWPNKRKRTNYDRFSLPKIPGTWKDPELPLTPSITPPATTTASTASDAVMTGAAE